MWERMRANVNHYRGYTGFNRLDRIAIGAMVLGVMIVVASFLLDADGLGASSAASCSSGAQQVSHVLAAMGVPTEWSRGSLRLSLGHFSTDADVDAALEIVPAAVARLRRFDGG